MLPFTLAQNSTCIWASFVRNHVTKNFQKSPSPVTLPAISNTNIKHSFVIRIMLDSVDVIAVVGSAHPTTIHSLLQSISWHLSKLKDTGSTSFLLLTSIAQFFLKVGQPRPVFCLFLFFSNTILLKKNWRSQRDSKSDRQSRRRARWPLDHHHGPNYSVCYFLLGLSMLVMIHC